MSMRQGNRKVRKSIAIIGEGLTEYPSSTLKQDSRNGNTMNTNNNMLHHRCGHDSFRLMYLVALMFLCPVLYGQSPTQAALLEKAYQDSSITLLNQFFDNWSSEVSPNESEARNKWVVEAHKVFKAFYQPLRLDKIGCDVNEFEISYQDFPYFIVQDTLYRIYIADTIPIGDDEFVAYCKKRINKMFPDDSTRKKELESLQRMIENDFLHMDFKREKYMFSREWSAIPIILVDSNISFRPSVSFSDKKVVHLTAGYERLLNTFLGNKHVEMGTESIMQVAYAKEESARRMNFIENAVQIFYGHWGGYWQYETYPMANSIIFDSAMQRAVVKFRFIYEGGDVFLEKRNGEWTVVSGKLTWIE